MVWLCCIDEFCDKAPRVTLAIPTCQDRRPCRIASPGECVDGLPGSPVVTEQGMCPGTSLLRPGYRKTVASTLAAPPCPPSPPQAPVPSLWIPHTGGKPVARLCSILQRSLGKVVRFRAPSITHQQSCPRNHRGELKGGPSAAVLRGWPSWGNVLLADPWDPEPEALGRTPCRLLNHRNWDRRFIVISCWVLE